MNNNKIMIRLFLFIAMFANIVYFGQSELDDKFIGWANEDKLKWEDFQGELDESSEYLAATSSYININFKQIGFSEAKIEVRTLFDKSESWVKLESDYLLEHEQLHFDIKELYSRKLRKAIINIKCHNIKELKSIVIDLHNKFEIEVNKYQSLYDVETNHSKNITTQKLWNKRVQGELENLKDYASPIFEIKLD